MPGCGAAGPDMMYPYRMPAGDMGVNGYSLSFNAFKSRMMFRELMSYCRPRWISDYVFGKFEQRVRIVTGFESSPGPWARCWRPVLCSATRARGKRRTGVWWRDGWSTPPPR